MTTYVDTKEYSFDRSRLQAPNHDPLLLAEGDQGPELIADDGDVIYSFPPGTTQREILFYLAGEIQGARAPEQRRNIERQLRGSLIEIIRLGARHSIRIESLINEALEFCDPEGPFCN
jgi:hypothetical protein